MGGLIRVMIDTDIAQKFTEYLIDRCCHIQSNLIDESLSNLIPQNNEEKTQSYPEYSFNIDSPEQHSQNNKTGWLSYVFCCSDSWLKPQTNDDYQKMEHN